MCRQVVGCVSAVLCRRVGWGPWSTPVAYTTAAGPPSAPTMLRTTEISPQTVMLVWEVPKKDNGEPVVDYCVRLRDDEKTTELSRTAEKFSLVTNLKPNSVNTIEVV
jgi:hypothetical protein